MSFQGAERVLADAWKLAQALNDPSLSASTMEFTGVLLINQGRYPQAIDTFESSLAAFQALANPRGAAIQHYHLARALRHRGPPRASPGGVQRVSCFVGRRA